MGIRGGLTDRQWKKVREFLDIDYTVGERGANDRGFVDAVLWLHRTGIPWRDLPSEFGPWKTVFNRFDRWSKQGKWDRLFQFLKKDVDTEWHSLDSTINRVHQHGAGGKGGRKRMGWVDRTEETQPKSI